MKYRHKPSEVEAVRYTGVNQSEVSEFTAGQAKFSGNDVVLRTFCGDVIARPGDYIVCDAAGEFYPCRPEVFEESYDAVKE